MQLLRHAEAQDPAAAELSFNTHCCIIKTVGARLAGQQAKTQQVIHSASILFAVS